MIPCILIVELWIRKDMASNILTNIVTWVGGFFVAAALAIGIAALVIAITANDQVQNSVRHVVDHFDDKQVATSGKKTVTIAANGPVGTNHKEQLLTLRVPEWVHPAHFTAADADKAVHLLSADELTGDIDLHFAVAGTGNDQKEYGNLELELVGKYLDVYQVPTELRTFAAHVQSGTTIEHHTATIGESTEGDAQKLIIRPFPNVSTAFTDRGATTPQEATAVAKDHIRDKTHGFANHYHLKLKGIMRFLKK